MVCCICKANQATVHLTQIAGAHLQRIDLCEACARTQGVNDPSGFSLAELLSSLNPKNGSRDSDRRRVE